MRGHPFHLVLVAFEMGGWVRLDVEEFQEQSGRIYKIAGHAKG